MAATEDLVDFVTRNVPVDRYLKEVVGFESPGISSKEARICCPFHQDDTPSLVVDINSGRWNCFGCESSGQSIVGFHQRLTSLDSLTAAAKDLFGKFIHPLIPEQDVSRYASNLLKVNSAYEYLRCERLISHDALVKYRIGFGAPVGGAQRFTIPIVNSFGLCTNLRLYTPTPAVNAPKILSYGKGYGKPTELFPFSVLRETAKSDTIVLCEGEWDALALISIGIPAMTATNGANSWPTQYNEYFRNRHIVLCYDNDEAGVKAVKKIIKILEPIAGSVRVLNVPDAAGKDVTDWIKHDIRMSRKSRWLELIDNLEPVSKNDFTPEGETLNVKLSSVVDQSHIDRNIEVLANIAAISAPSYVVCSHAKITLREKCNAHADEDIKPEREIRIDMRSALALATLSTTHAASTRVLLQIGQCCKRCSWDVHPIRYQLVHRVIISPPFDRSDSTTEAAARRNYEAYIVDHALLPNRTYKLGGRLVADPQSQEATLLFTDALPIKNPIELFQITPQIHAQLKKTFRPERMSVQYIRDKLRQRADWLIRNRTRIYDRHNMHLVADIAWHSVPAFAFQGELINRGMIELLILGDTSTGKGTMINAMLRTYGLGDICSGEHATVAGLTCALHQERGRWICEWGKMPLNHRGLLVVDEMQSLPVEDLSKMSRVRSEGVVETSKVIKEAAPAMLRIIWLANPRDGRHMGSYGFGIEAVRDLFGATEDIRRLDLVYIVTMSDVPSKTINRLELPDTTDSTDYKDEDFQNLIKWVWSRSADQVMFSRKASRWILEAAERLGSRYSSTIPIIQVENVRFKLAKVAAAIAALTYSTNKGGHRISVKLGHAKFTEQLFNELYSNKNIAYSDLSDSDAIAGRCDATVLSRIFNVIAPPKRKQVIQTIISQGHMTASVLKELIGDADVARDLISCLFECGAIRIGKYHPTIPLYVKTPVFVEWLRKENRTIHERAKQLIASR